MGPCVRHLRWWGGARDRGGGVGIPAAPSVFVMPVRAWGGGETVTRVAPSSWLSLCAHSRFTCKSKI